MIPYTVEIGSVNWLATLEAMLLKRPNRYKSALPPAKPFYEEKDTKQGEMIEAILIKYPQHKRVLFFKSKYDNNEILSPADNTELEKFYKLLKEEIQSRLYLLSTIIFLSLFFGDFLSLYT